jgi:hypothetical protein
MTKLIWIVLALFVIGNALFVLPYHFSDDSVKTSYFINYKKDTDLLRAVFPDSGTIHLRLNMPERFNAIYKQTDSAKKQPEKQSYLLVNISISDNLDFTALAFPFYKRTNFNGIISFSNIIRISNISGKDSTALIGNITINGRLTIKGICTPVYARTLIEKELVSILKKEMDKVEKDINRPVLADTTFVNTPSPEHY